MYSDNKKIRDVADVAARIMMGEKALHPNQQKLDVHEPEKDELTADDFKKLRAGKKAPEVKKEEVESPSKESMEKAASDKKIKHEIATDRIEQKQKNMMKKATSDKKMKEEIEQIEELVGKGKLPQIASYHKQKGDEAKGKMEIIRNTNTTVPVPKEKSAKIYAKDAEATQHYTQAKRAKALMNKEEVEQEEKSMTFSEMLAAYKEHGLAVIAEEPTQDEYEKEIKKAQAKSEGKEKAEVAKAAVQAVKNEETHTKIQVIDMTDPNNIQKSEIDLEERSLTEPEAKKKEEIVKSMKKKMPGFKERYGERAKEVMYATATKMAKKD
jgi:hypothetical protein